MFIFLKILFVWKVTTNAIDANDVFTRPSLQYHQLTLKTRFKRTYNYNT